MKSLKPKKKPTAMQALTFHRAKRMLLAIEAPLSHWPTG
jgi:hypothetical protein